MYHPTEPGGEPPLIEVSCWSHNLESNFMLGRGPVGQGLAMLSARRTPDKYSLCAAIRRRGGEGQCRSPIERGLASRLTSGIGNGVMPSFPAARCTPRAAVRLPVMEATPGRLHPDSGLPGGIALRATKRSACYRTFLQPGCPAFCPQSRPASSWHPRPRAWSPRRMHSVGPR